MLEPSFRALVGELDREGMLRKISSQVSTRLEAASLAAHYDGTPVLIERPDGGSIPVVAGIGSDRRYYALALGVQREELLHRLSGAFKATEKPEEWQTGPCKDIITKNPDLDKLPLLTHFEGDGGPYITSGVAIVRDPELGQNMCFHRLMQAGPDRLVARIVEGRGTHTALKKEGELDIAICIGAPLHVQLAAACAPPPGHDEMLIAAGLCETPVVRAESSDLLVPAYSEIVLEGRITSELAEEGPFVDLTQTPDTVRMQNVVELTRMTTRTDPLYQALVPSSLEHKLLMGMPREPSIFHCASREVAVKNVLITPGGCSWLHAAVQIRKRKEDDGRRAIALAFEGHTSLKHCVVVDEDIDIYDPADIEWAVATRFQAGRDLVLMERQGGSSLDPSATHEQGKKSLTDKVGIDATIPLDRDRRHFEKVRFAPVDPETYS
jgi:UbiD family decarboxylase